jgi:16S rRNA (guanine527-N7)-methyltransferase
MGVDVPAAAADALAGILGDMLAEPQNLSAVRDMDTAIWLHGVDSLSGLLLDEIRDAPALLDIGSGGGFPGLALAAMLPDIPVTLVESERRKAAWLIRASAGFPNVRVVADRSETLARAERDAHPVVTARALGPLPVVLELAAPLLAPRGRLVAWRGRRDADDRAAAATAAGALGMSFVGDPDAAPIPDASRHFSIWEKATDTPVRYPRRPGMAAKRPLG